MSLTKVHNRMIDGSVANVLDFGADPTGSIDSQSAIQAAIDSGKPAYLPSGTYRVDSTLTIGTRGKGLIGASPIRRDYAADGYQSYTVLGLFQFGSFGFSMPFLHIGHQPRALFFQGHREQHKRGQLFETWEGRWGAGF